jgi:hypothetical protein
MSFSVLIAKSGQVATIYRGSYTYLIDHAGTAVESLTVVASDVMCVIQVTTRGMQQLERGLVITRGLKGYFPLGTNIQEGDWIRVRERSGAIYMYRVVPGLDRTSVAPVAHHMEVDLELDLDSSVPTGDS